MQATTMARWRVGVDSGGTFTDICLFEEAEGRLEIWKVPSTPDDPSRGIADAVEQGMRRVAADVNIPPAACVTYFGHGTTIATNALIQHRGITPALLTTAGFRDLLEIGRQKRPDLYDLFADKPLTLVPRNLRLEISERVRHDGEIETPLDLCAVREAAKQLRAANAGADAICFLYSFVRPEHEREAKRIVEEELPGVFVCASHEIAPEFREFERLSTTVVNAYLGPVMRGYISKLAPRLAALGMTATAHITQSNGGVIGFETAGGMPVRAGLRGPLDRRGRGSTGGQGARVSKPDHLRHGRHVNGCCAPQAWRAAPCLRGNRAWLSREGPDARHPHGRSRRRIDCVCRQRRAPESRAAQRRCRSGTGLLRARQRRADGDRRQYCAPDAQPILSSRRAHGGAAGSCETSDRAASREARPLAD